MNRREFLSYCVKAGISVTGFLAYANILTGKGFAIDSVLARKDCKLLEGDMDGLSVSPIKYITKKTADELQYPSVAVDSNDKIWIVFTKKEGDKTENILLCNIEGETFSEPLKINASAGFEYDPQIINTPAGLAVVWTSKRDGGNSIVRMRIIKDGTPGEEIIISDENGINWKPSVAAASDGSVWIAWEYKTENNFAIAARKYEKGTLSGIINISDAKDKDARRPSVAADSKGKMYCVYDLYEGNANADIYLASLTDNKDIERMKISENPAMDFCPTIDIDIDDNVWIVWHSNGTSQGEVDIPRWFELRCVKDGQIYEPITSPKDKDLTRNWENQSFEFPKVKCSSDGRIIIMGRPSHNFCVQYYYGNEWSPLYRLVEDGWGGRGKYMMPAFTASGELYVTRRDLGSDAVQKISGLVQEKKTPEVKPVNAGVSYPSIAPNLEEKILYDPVDNLNFYFGELHGHSWMSDGMNDLDEYYLYYRDVLKYDFAVLTDHDNFVGKFLLPSEWEEQKIMAAHYNKPGTFATLYGQEWTSGRPPSGYGHKNIYHIDPSIELFDHQDKRYDTTPKLFAKLKEIGAICAPHHIGWTNADFDNHDPVVQPMYEIVSNHGAFEYMGNEPIYHRGSLKGNFILDGLKRGLKFGIVGGSDCHGLIWHHQVGWKRNCHNTGVTCVMAEKLSSEAIFEALKKRRVYATSGPKIKIEFKINDRFIMGDEAILSKDEKVKITAKITSPVDIKWIKLIKNGEILNHCGGEAFFTRYSYVDDASAPGDHFYYLRIITEDGNMAWTTPIWIKIV